MALPLEARYTVVLRDRTRCVIERSHSRDEGFPLYNYAQMAGLGLGVLALTGRYAYYCTACGHVIFPTTSRASLFPTVDVSGRRHPRS